MFTTAAKYCEDARRRYRDDTALVGYAFGLFDPVQARICHQAGRHWALRLPVLPWELCGHGNVARSLTTAEERGRAGGAPGARLSCPEDQGLTLGSEAGAAFLALPTIDVPLFLPESTLSYHSLQEEPRPRQTSLSHRGPFSTDRTWISFIRGPRLRGEGSTFPNLRRSEYNRERELAVHSVHIPKPLLCARRSAWC